MNRVFVSGCALLVLLVAATPCSTAADGSTAATFEWNVFLGDWHVVGPFVSLDSARPLETKCLEDESVIGSDAPIEYDGRTLAWRFWPRPQLNIIKALESTPEKCQHCFCYAWTSFLSEEARPAVLSLSYDDTAAVWLNGVEVHRDNDSNGNAMLDQALVAVDLRAGANTLLLKVGQREQQWHAVARLLPSGGQDRLIVMKCDRGAGGELSAMPTIEVDLLDDQGRTLDSLRASGYRGNPTGTRYSFAIPDPTVAPAAVRVRYSDRDLVPVDQTHSWSEALSGEALIPLKADRKLVIIVRDADTREPIVGALYWPGVDKPAIASDESGRIEVPDESPITPRRSISAEGYDSTPVKIDWPWPAESVVELRRGGRTLAGRVTAVDGTPIVGAKIDAGMFQRGYAPVAFTDANGQFEISSIVTSQEQLYPVITAAGYLPKDGFSLNLGLDSVTRVEWTLTPGAEVFGRVTAKDDGRPLAGIKILTGQDRFSSNRDNPSVETDSDGRYRLRSVAPGSSLVHAFSENFAPSMTRVYADLSRPVEANFELEVGSAVTGRVVDSEGNPIRKVWIVTDTWSGARMFQRQTYTDANGEFRLEHMPSTPAIVHVLKENFVSLRNVAMVGGQRLDLTFERESRHQVQLELAGDDSPMPLLQVQKGYLWSGQDQVSWMKLQEFELERSYDPNTRIFQITVDEPINGSVSYRFRYPGYEDAIVEIPTAGLPSQSFHVVLEKVQGFKGRVVSAETGQPLAGMAVALVSKPERLRSFYVEFRHPAAMLPDFTGVHAVSDAEGNFELPVPANMDETGFVVTRLDDGFVHIAEAKPWIESGTCELPYPASGSIEGQLTVAGDPAASEIIQITWLGTIGGSENWVSPFGCGGQKTTDANGRYEFKGLGPGRYRVNRVRSFNRAGGGISMHMIGEEVLLLPGDRLTHDIHQPAGHSITGQATDADGQAMVDCVVTLTCFNANPRGDRVDAVRADGQGRFAFAHVAAGEYELLAEHYATTNTAQCGLGEVDFRGTASAWVPKQDTVEIMLESAVRSSLAVAESIAGAIPPDFDATPLDSTTRFSLGEQLGKVVAIDFWATWCGPCLAVMPQLKTLHEKYRDDRDVVFITVSLDEDEERLRSVLKEQGLEFPVIFSGDGWRDEIARAFGVTAIPSSFVIGRDGRFAAEKLHGAALAQAVETALAKPVDPALFAGSEMSRLNVRLTLDGDETGIPGATIHLRAIDASGETVREDELTPPGMVKRFVWRFPTMSEGGKIVGHVEARGVKSAEQTLEPRDDEGTMIFDIVSPRTLSGKVTADDGKVAAPGVKVTLSDTVGFQRSTVTDADGAFQLSTLPGAYHLAVEGNDDFATTGRRPREVIVSAEIDPPSVALAVTPAVAVKGVVVDQLGLAVAGAMIRSDQGAIGDVKTNEKGEFEVRGVPSRGRVMLYAISGGAMGAVTLSDEPRADSARIVLGQGVNGATGGLSPGLAAPSLKARSLADQVVEWSPDGAHDRLVVLCELAHPLAHQFIDKAQAWAAEHAAELDVLSIDWSFDQCRRELAKLGLTIPVAFAGPGGLAITKEWGVDAPLKAVLISADGKIKSAPKSGELP